MHKNKNYYGFTLIELSIVLIIIGLIIGGVMVGRDLIEASRIRAIVSGHQDFTARWNNFKIKYNCFAGDCPNATEFFGTSGTCPTPTTTATCNGNGDKWVDWTTGGESRLVWNHMALANLSSYSFINLQGNSSNYNNAFYAVPSFYQAPVGWVVGSTSSQNFAQMYSGGAGNNSATSMRGIGLQTTRANSLAQSYAPHVAVETPEVARNIDVKIDDGIPATGKFQANGGMKYDTATLLACITGSNSNSAYDLTQTEPTCRYIYNLEQ